jgi:membrane protease YdiL (CAAX protease family)
MLQKMLRQHPAPSWSYLSALTGLIAMFLAVVMGTTIASIVLQDTQLTIFVGWCVGMALTIAYVIISRGDDVEDLRLRAMKTRLPLVALFAFGMAILFDLMSWVFANNQTLASAELLRVDTQTMTFVGWVIVLIFLAILQPIAEEIVLRGLMYPALSAALGGRLGFFMTAIFHGMFHLLAYAPPPTDGRIMIWYGLILPILQGIVLTGVRAVTGSTRASMVAHAMFGIFALLKVITFA